MPAILPSINIDADATLTKCFAPHQVHWIQAEDAIHAAKKQAFALAEKSVRIGWTYADAFKNVRKRLRFKKRDYLFATKDYPSALEYIRLCEEFADLLDFARAILTRNEGLVNVPRLNDQGRPTGFTDEVKMGSIKFDNGSRIIAFSASPQAMAVYGGDVGLDEFAKHSNPRLLWETAQGRVAWGHDLALWSSHDGQDTLFNQFVQDARNGAGPWNLYYRVTMPDAIQLGLLDIINRLHNTAFTPDQYLADCRARAGLEEVFQQAYMCNPLGASSANIVEWSVIQRCLFDYEILRLHLEHSQIVEQFGVFDPASQSSREQLITESIHRKFLKLFATPGTYRLGFDVAASGQGDLAVIYIDELVGSDLWLRALFSCRTEDWHFLGHVLYCFLRELPHAMAAGDETGLGRQICWETARYFPGRFTPVNFASKKHDIGFTIMNQLATSQKRFPRSHQDIASDFFALRKSYAGTRWAFSEGTNALNPASHCDIAWAGGLATEANDRNRFSAGAWVA